MTASPSLDWLTQVPFAHRGLHDASAGIMENSLSAVTAARDAGYGIEIDIQPAADFTPIVFHDDTLNRMTPERGPVRALSPEELTKIPLKGSTTGDTIPSLTQVLAEIDGRTPLLIEIKSKGDTSGRFETAIVKTVEGYDGPFALMSFEPSVLTHLRRMAPEVPRGLVSEAYWLQVFWPHLSGFERLRRRLMLHAVRTAPHFIAYYWRDLRNPFLKLSLMLAPKPLLTWTVKSEADADAIGTRADQLIFEQFLPDIAK